MHSVDIHIQSFVQQQKQNKSTRLRYDDDCKADHDTDDESLPTC